MSIVYTYNKSVMISIKLGIFTCILTIKILLELCLCVEGVSMALGGKLYTNLPVCVSGATVYFPPSTIRGRLVTGLFVCNLNY
jgi:hypothetical protein